MVVMDAQVIPPINKILSVTSDHLLHLEELKIQVIEFLLHLIEQPQNRITSKMIVSLEYHNFVSHKAKGKALCTDFFFFSLFVTVDEHQSAAGEP
jgi:hypothetical protein